MMRSYLVKAYMLKLHWLHVQESIEISAITKYLSRTETAN